MSLKDTEYFAPHLKVLLDRARSAISHENSEELAGIMLEVEKLSLPEKEAGDFIQRVFFGFIFKSNFNPPRDFVAQFQERLQAEPSSLGKLLGLMMDYISPMPKEALALSVLDDLEKKRIPRTEETLRCVLQSLVKHQNISVESLFFLFRETPSALYQIMDHIKDKHFKNHALLVQEACQLFSFASQDPKNAATLADIVLREINNGHTAFFGKNMGLLAAEVPWEHEEESFKVHVYTQAVIKRYVLDTLSPPTLEKGVYAACLLLAHRPSAFDEYENLAREKGTKNSAEPTKELLSKVLFETLSESLVYPDRKEFLPLLFAFIEKHSKKEDILSRGVLESLRSPKGKRPITENFFFLIRNISPESCLHVAKSILSHEESLPRSKSMLRKLLDKVPCEDLPLPDKKFNTLEWYRNYHALRSQKNLQASLPSKPHSPKKSRLL